MKCDLSTKINVNLRTRVYWYQLWKIKNRNELNRKQIDDSDGHMYLSVDSLIEINNIITGSKNKASKKINISWLRSNRISKRTLSNNRLIE